MAATGIPCLLCLLLTLMYGIRKRGDWGIPERRDAYIMGIVFGLLVSFCVLVLEPLVIEQILAAFSRR